MTNKILVLRLNHFLLLWSTAMFGLAKAEVDLDSVSTASERRIIKQLVEADEAELAVDGNWLVDQTAILRHFQEDRAKFLNGSSTGKLGILLALRDAEVIEETLNRYHSPGLRRIYGHVIAAVGDPLLIPFLAGHLPLQITNQYERVSDHSTFSLPFASAIVIAQIASTAGEFRTEVTNWAAQAVGSTTISSAQTAGPRRDLMPLRRDVTLWWQENKEALHAGNYAAVRPPSTYEPTKVETVSGEGVEARSQPSLPGIRYSTATSAAPAPVIGATPSAPERDQDSPQGLIVIVVTLLALGITAVFVWRAAGRRQS